MCCYDYGRFPPKYCRPKGKEASMLNFPPVCTRVYGNMAPICSVGYHLALIHTKDAKDWQSCILLRTMKFSEMHEHAKLMNRYPIATWSRQRIRIFISMYKIWQTTLTCMPRHIWILRSVVKRVCWNRHMDLQAFLAKKSAFESFHMPFYPWSRGFVTTHTLLTWTFIAPLNILLRKPPPTLREAMWARSHTRIRYFTRWYW